MAGLIYVISWLPVSLLYVLSWLIFFLFYYVPGYRKKVVYNNLYNAFPEKSRQELLAIRRRFYRHLSCLFAEVVKILSLSPENLKRRCKFTAESKELINSYLQNNKSVIIVMGHYGNWEWCGTSFYVNFGISSAAVYRPVKNKAFDRLMKRLRTRLGVNVYPMKDFPRQMFALRKQTNCIILIADQTPSRTNAHWVEFLNQETPVYKGTARLSKTFNYPLIFCLPRPVKRGYYEVHAKLIAETPKEYDEESISKMHTRILEEEIIKAPEYWLWTHKRWKHKRSG